MSKARFKWTVPHQLPEHTVCIYKQAAKDLTETEPSIMRTQKRREKRRVKRRVKRKTKPANTSSGI